MHQLITKIGKGQRGAKDLSWGEAKQAAQDLIEGNATPYQAGAFLMAMRIKLEGVTELASFTAATRSYVPPISVPAGLNVVDVPVYAEKHNTQHACLPAAVIAASAGATILFHGMDNPAAASDLPRVLGQLGVPATLQGQDLLASLQRNGFAYLDVALYHPPLAKLLALREQLGAQNLFHQVARLLNPTRAHSQVVGVAHPPYLEKMPEAVNMLGGHRLLVFQGMEGFPELSMAIPTVMRELRNNRVTPFTLKPTDVQLPLGSFQHMAVPSEFLRQGSGQALRPSSGQAPSQDLPAREAALIRQVLTTQILPGSGQARFRDWILYNAATFLYAAGQAHSIAEGVPLAQKALESGAAARKLADLASPPAPIEGAGQGSTMNPPSPQPPSTKLRTGSPPGGEGVSQPKVLHA